jgi:hypothetical protein
MAPSQSTEAVAGVQFASRQQCWLVPFFHVMPVLLTQLSTVVDWAKAPDDKVRAAVAAVAMIDATLLSLFMILL